MSTNAMITVTKLGRVVACNMIHLYYHSYYRVLNYYKRHKKSHNRVSREITKPTKYII